MHYSTIISVAAIGLAATVVADTMIVREVCYFSGCGYSATFQTTAGLYIIPGSDGCHRNPGPPGMTELCIDHPRQRAHFKFNHQSFKRCLRATSNKWVECGTNSCWETIFDEVSCTWREAPGLEGEEEGELATASATIEGRPTSDTPAAGTDESLFDDVNEE